jgi:hypothetical protein
LETTVTIQNLIQEEIRRRLDFDNSCYHSIQNLLISRLLSRKLKIGISKTIILPAVLYGCETWPPTVRVEHRLMVFEKRVLRRRIFGPKKHKATGDWKKLQYEDLRDLYPASSIITIFKSLRMI